MLTQILQIKWYVTKWRRRHVDVNLAITQTCFAMSVGRVWSCAWLGTGVAQLVQCMTTARTVGVRSPTQAEDFSSNLCVQTGSGAHPASCTVGTGGSLSRGEARPGRDADHSPPSSAEVKKE
jgi:hypothetical protein